MTEKPKWLVIGDEIIATSVGEAFSTTNQVNLPNLQIKPIPFISVCHLNSCLALSIDSNEKGWHSAAVCLLRQCIEALTIIEIGLQDASYAEPLLFDWAQGKKSHGDLRKSLETEVWPTYGAGLWDEPWSKYFSNLARAVQPYAHYSPELQGWQWATVKQLSESSFVLGIGPQTYDALKASRITLLHVLTGWTLARILLATGRSGIINQRKERIDELRQELSRSKLLFKGEDWATQLMPHVFFKPGHSFLD